MDAAALARVEQQRLDLEANISKLRKALRHWQTLEIDYESLKEEFYGIDEDATGKECASAANNAGLELVDEKDIESLLLDSNSRPRKPAQLMDVLSKRVDYVSRNVQTIRKQLSEAEKKRNALLLAEEPEHREEAGLPLAEITEELDDSGHVVSSKVETPGANAPQLIDALKKAGVENLDEVNGTITAADSSKKSDTQHVASYQEPARTATAEVSNQVVQGNQESILPTSPEDTAAEAELRREMLEYSRGLDEVGAIVAELELEEEDASSLDDDEADLEFNSDIDDEDPNEDSEDETGKSKNSLSLSKGYLKKMEALQEKLGLKNVGSESQVEPANRDLGQGQRPSPAEAARKAAIARHEATNVKQASADESNTNKSTEKKAAKKRVAFSSELDIAPERPADNNSAPTRNAIDGTQKSASRPITESILERSLDNEEAGAPAPPRSAIKEAKQSRFKAAKQSQPQTPMFASPMTLSTPGDENDPSSSHPPKTIATTLVERPASSKAPKAPDPYDFSDESHGREIALEYEQHRIKRILAQDGGFVGNGEDGEMTPLEDENGKRISRFRAARIHR